MIVKAKGGTVRGEVLRVDPPRVMVRWNDRTKKVCMPMASTIERVVG